MNVVAKKEISKKVAPASNEEIPPTSQHRSSTKCKDHSRRHRDPPILRQRNEKDFIHPPMPVRKQNFPFSRFKYRPPKAIPDKSVPQWNASYVKLTKSFFGNESLGSIQSNILKTQQKCAALDQTCEEFMPPVTSTPIPSAQNIAKNAKCLDAADKAKGQASQETKSELDLQNIIQEDDFATTRMSKYLADCVEYLQREKDKTAHEKQLSIETSSFFQENNTEIIDEHEPSFFKEQNGKQQIFDETKQTYFSRNAANFLDVILECEQSNELKDWNVSFNENRFSDNQIQQRKHGSEENFQLANLLESALPDFFNMTEPISCYYPGVDVLQNSTMEAIINDPSLANNTFDHLFYKADQKRVSPTSSNILNDIRYDQLRGKQTSKVSAFLGKELEKLGGTHSFSHFRRLRREQIDTCKLVTTTPRNYNSQHILEERPTNYLQKSSSLPQTCITLTSPRYANHESNTKRIQDDSSINENYTRTRRYSNSSEFYLPPMDVKWEPYFPAQFSTPSQQVNDTFAVDHQELAYKTEKILESIEKDLTESPTFRYSPRKMF